MSQCFWSKATKTNILVKGPSSSQLWQLHGLFFLFAHVPLLSWMCDFVRVCLVNLVCICMVLHLCCFVFSSSLSGLVYVDICILRLWPCLLSTEFCIVDYSLKTFRIISSSLCVIIDRNMTPTERFINMLTVF